MEPVSALAVSAAALAVALLALWGIARALRDVGIVDVFWGAGFVGVAWIAWTLAAAPGARGALLALGVTLWGLRLSGYLLWRNWGEPEDRRYRAMRRGHGERFAWVSLVTVFGLQGVLLWWISLPVQTAMLWPGADRLGRLDALGIGLFAVGFFFESVGDCQLARFKRDPANAEQVMDRGLWRYTRHPNYFGDFLVWWGLFVVALSTPAGRWTLSSPLLMSLLLLRVSGVPLLERGLTRRRPAYRDYIARTSAFFPRPPRRD